MHALRALRFLRRLVLAWFVGSLLAAVASPLVNPQSMELVCSAGGAVKLVVQSDDGPAEMGVSAMHCSLCMVPGSPPSTVQINLPAPLPLGRALQPIPAARLAAATASPLPARGPPARS